ncbi:hypothetical protein [Krasilnikovia sp. MM14-A1004]|uniref:hypothetical protein n=1 Tax=Krasilnikovia sp. MM14-A1004 TaxID=3373541 RepID=UPI00399D25A4
MSGVWVTTHDTDLVLYEAATSTPHRHHIIAHELAHMLCGHSGVEAIDDEAARLLFPDLDPALVQQMLRRSGYPHRDEQEAEVVATVLLERLNRAVPEEVGCIPMEDAAILARIDRSLRSR